MAKYYRVKAKLESRYKSTIICQINGQRIGKLGYLDENMLISSSAKKWISNYEPINLIFEAIADFNY